MANAAGRRALGSMLLLIGGAMLAGASSPRMPRQAGSAVDTIAVGRGKLTPRIFQTRTDTFDVVRVSKDGRRDTSSMMVESVSAPSGGIVTLMVRTDGVVYTDRVRVGSAAPVSHRTQAPTDSAELRFTDGRIQGWASPMGETRMAIDLPIPREASPFANTALVMRGLPFAPGYRALIRGIGAFSGRLEWRTVRVVGAETVRVKGRAERAWIVEEGDANGRAIRRHWISDADRRTSKVLNLRIRSDSVEIWWFRR